MKTDTLTTVIATLGDYPLVHDAAGLVLAIGLPTLMGWAFMRLLLCGLDALVSARVRDRQPALYLATTAELIPTTRVVLTS